MQLYAIQFFYRMYCMMNNGWLGEFLWVHHGVTTNIIPILRIKFKWISFYLSIPGDKMASLKSCDRNTFENILRSIKAAKLGVMMILSLWHLAGISAAVEKLKPEFRGFETSRDLAVRRAATKQIEGQSYSHCHCPNTNAVILKDRGKMIDVKPQA